MLDQVCRQAKALGLIEAGSQDLIDLTDILSLLLLPGGPNRVYSELKCHLVAILVWISSDDATLEILVVSVWSMTYKVYFNITTGVTLYMWCI